MILCLVVRFEHAQTMLCFDVLPCERVTAMPQQLGAQFAFIRRCKGSIPFGPFAPFHSKFLLSKYWHLFIIKYA